MQQYVNNNNMFYNIEEDMDLTVNLKKILLSSFKRINIIIPTFLIVLVIFICFTFILPKKYTVSADIYLKNSNSTNLSEFNPYLIENFGGSGGLAEQLGTGTSSALTNELEIIKSPLVLDKVIRENNIKYGKRFGIFPNKKEGEYLSAVAFVGKGKILSFKNKKGTNIITIEYTSKKPELAYNIVSSIITNYIDLHKGLNSEKSKSDKELLEKEYKQAKAQLDERMKTVSGLPSTAIAGSGNISAMSAFSKSAQRAMSNIQGQYVAGEKSQLAVKEDAEKVAQLARKLEWAKLVDEMSDSSKVLILKEPQQLRDFEYSSPKLLINIILGIVFGILASLIAVIYKELTDKKLTYSMLGDDILYKDKDTIINLKSDLLANADKRITFALFENIPDEIQDTLKNFKNITFVKADISNDLIEKAKNSDIVYLISTINKTDSKLYKQIIKMLKKINIKTIKDLLV